MCCWMLEVCPVPRAIVCLPGTGVDCTLLKQMRSGQRHSGSTMPYTTSSPCPIAALPSIVLTGGQGTFQSPVSPSGGSLQCQPWHAKPCPTCSCGRDLCGVDWPLGHWLPIPGRVPLLAMKPAMSMGLLSMERFLMQPMNCLLCTGKSSGKFGTPPRRRGPVRSKDLKKQRNAHNF